MSVHVCSTKEQSTAHVDLLEDVSCTSLKLVVERSGGAFLTRTDVPKLFLVSYGV